MQIKNIHKLIYFISFNISLSLRLLILSLLPSMASATLVAEGENTVIPCEITLTSTPRRLDQDQRERLKAALTELLPALAKAEPTGILSSSRLQALPKEHPIIEAHLGPALGFSLSGVTIYQYIKKKFNPEKTWDEICEMYALPPTQHRIRRWEYFKFLFHVWKEKGKIDRRWISELEPDSQFILDVFGVAVTDLNKRLKKNLPRRKEIAALLEGLFLSSTETKAKLEKNLNFILFLFEVLTHLKYEAVHREKPYLMNFPTTRYAPFILKVIKKWEQTGKSLDAFFYDPDASKAWLTDTLHEMIIGNTRGTLKSDPQFNEALQHKIRKLVKESWFWKE